MRRPLALGLKPSDGGEIQARAVHLDQDEPRDNRRGGRMILVA
ncbi:MAG TPA: hypothetical protein VGF45_20445 [Polyangia bacterium]